MAAKRGKLQTEDLISLFLNICFIGFIVLIILFIIKSCSVLEVIIDFSKVFLVRKDRKKYTRVLELLRMNEELKRARKAFDLEEKP